MGTQEPDLIPEGEIAAMQAERIAQFGEAVGLHEDTIHKVQTRGQNALIDRAQRFDKTGALGRVMSICQRLGCWMQENEEAGGTPPQPGQLIEAIAGLGDEHDIDRLVALRLVGTVIEVFQQATGSIARGSQNGMGTGVRTATSGRPGAAKR